MMRLAVLLCDWPYDSIYCSYASRAAPCRAYKGAWRGLHVGIGADTTWSSRLSPMRGLQGHPPWAVSGSAMGLPSVVRHGPIFGSTMDMSSNPP
jgi:hypothetical protein